MNKWGKDGISITGVHGAMYKSFINTSLMARAGCPCDTERREELVRLGGSSDAFRPFRWPLGIYLFHVTWVGNKTFHDNDIQSRRMDCVAV